MKIWVVILILAAIGLIVFFMRRREKFSSGAIQPTCPGEFMLVGDKCRIDGVDFGEDGQCPPGTAVNEEGSCQFPYKDPMCGPEYTLTVEDGIAMCEPNIRPVEPTDEDNQARQESWQQCPVGYTRDYTVSSNIVRCMRDSGRPPVCPSGSTFDRDVYSWSQTVALGDIVCFGPSGISQPICPAGTSPGYIYSELTDNIFTCLEYLDLYPPAPPTVVKEVVAEEVVAEKTVVEEKPKAQAPRPPPKELVFQPKLLGTSGTDVVPADTRIDDLFGGLFSPGEEQQQSRRSQYTL